ncbi:MAG: hypothetical protein CMJ45_13010 [Planctomyces sp.]|nr:hypothetical protein [Planctomyces sp.]
MWHPRVLRPFRWFSDNAHRFSTLQLTTERTLDLKPDLHIVGGDTNEFEKIGVKEDGRRGYNPWVQNFKLLRIDNDSGMMAQRCRVRIRTMEPEPTLEHFPADLHWLSNGESEIDIEPGGSSYIILTEHRVRDGEHDGELFWPMFLAQPNTEFKVTVVAFAQDSNTALESFVIRLNHPEDQIPTRNAFPSVKNAMDKT